MEASNLHSWEVYRDLIRNPINFHKDMIQGYLCTIDFNGNFQVKYKEPKVKYVEIEICQLKAGDIFSFKSSYDKLESNFRVVDKEDYKKVFGEYYPYAKSSDSILAYCILEKRFTHFNIKDKVKIPQKQILLGNLPPHKDFEYEGFFYFLDKFEDNAARCIKLNKIDAFGCRIFYFGRDLLVYILD